MYDDYDNYDDDDYDYGPFTYTPTRFIAHCNDTLSDVYDDIDLIGEVDSFKVNQGKWVFFDVKDEESSVGCFMTIYDLHMPLEDGMKVRLRGYPKITKWGKFSFTVKKITPIGEGSIKKSFELLKKKLRAEGLFDYERKRTIPENLSYIGVISSTQAAGYADFIKILNERWGGLKVKVAHTQVQGLDAPEQIIRALDYFNEQGQVQIIAILRGGGSADDLSAFNDEQLVRAIARSKIPVITGIGHEVDESLADLAADIRASTPSNAAQLLTPDREAQIDKLREHTFNIESIITDRLNSAHTELLSVRSRIRDAVNLKISSTISQIRAQLKTIERLNPDKILSQGYALVTGRLATGSVVKITTLTHTATAEIKSVKKRS